MEQKKMRNMKAVSMIVAGLALLLDLLQEELTVGLLRPRFGERRCWFYGKSPLNS